MRAVVSRLLWTVALASPVLALSADVSAGGCVKDGDCKAGRVCQKGVCVEPTKVEAPKKACSKDKDCPGDEICTDGACTKPATPAPTATPTTGPGGSAPPPGSGPPATPPPPGSATSGAPPGAAPPSAYPPGAYPPGAYPPGAYPPGAYPPGAYPPPPGSGYPPGQPADWQYASGPVMEYRNKGLMIAGAVLLPVGFLAAMAGGIGGGITAAEGTGYLHNDHDFPWQAGIPIGIGGAFMITGIVFLSIGAPKVPAEEQPPPSPLPPNQPASTPPQVSVIPIVGPGSGGIFGTF